MADLVFLTGISHTQSKGGCKVVAGLLHLFFLGSFSWMLLEGVQLYLMVVLVFNITIRPLYLYAVGYGLPLAIVIISAITYPDGYGTTQHVHHHHPQCFLLHHHCLEAGPEVL
uniref:G-protein coupled receptors family 2 profile 2 domain-containing protein n=1 Tax=Hucho hucho TaxID=62062 RepID=A0A4W5L307_9TELE